MSSPTVSLASRTRSAAPNRVLRKQPRLPQRFAQHHGGSDRHVERAQTATHGDTYARIGHCPDAVRYASGFAAKQQSIVGCEAKLGKGKIAAHAEEDEPAGALSARALCQKLVPAHVPGEIDERQIVQRRALQRTI